MNIFLSGLCLLPLGGCRVSGGFQKTSAEFRLLSAGLFRPSRLPVDRRVRTLIFKAPFSGWREIFSLKCPSLWLSEITPPISCIRERNKNKEVCLAVYHPTVSNTLDFLFVCVIGRICGLLPTSSFPLSLTHLHSSHSICLLSIILIYFPSELQVDSSECFFSAVAHKPDPLRKAFQDKRALNL